MIGVIFLTNVKRISSLVLSFILFTFLFFSCLSSVSFASSVTYSDLLVDIAALSPAGPVLDFANVLLDVYKFFFEDTVLRDRELQRSEYLAAWKTITDNSSMIEDQFVDYWQTCIDELGLADDRLIMIEDTVRLGLTLEDVISHCYHSDGNGVSVSSDGQVQISGQRFKQLVDYWSDYYKPKDNPSQYFYNYQSAPKKTVGSYTMYRFDPGVPIYTSDGGSNMGWGFKNWSGGMYFLPFFSDDNLGFYYCDKYFHVYSIRDDSFSLVLDILYLTDGSVYQSYTFDWDSSYPTISFNFWEGYLAFQLQGFSSYFNYMSKTSLKSFQTINTSYFSFCSGLLSDVKTITLETALRSTSTFTPDTNSYDDWGYICSSDPFVLWINQTDIDTTKIPDDYIVTVSGDTVYDYSITNTAGDTTTINNYITNNYTVPVSDTPGSGGSGTSSGNVTVSGNINLIVNPSIPSYDDYVASLPNKSDTLSDYLKVFFDFLPAELLALILGGVATAIICRILRR